MPKRGPDASPFRIFDVVVRLISDFETSNFELGCLPPLFRGGAMNDVLLETKGLHRSFGGVHAVKDVSFDVPTGAIKAVIGPNGAGKTTLFNLIAGTLAPHRGEVVFRGKPITGRKPHAVAALGIARTFQTTKLFPHMTVLENVMVGRHPRHALRLPRRHAEPALDLAGGSADGGRRPGPSSTISAWPPTPARRPATCPSAASGWWNSPGPWPRSRRCCCSTSRRRGSTSTRPRSCRS